MGFWSAIPVEPMNGGTIRYQSKSASAAAWRGFNLLFLEPRIVARDAFRSLPSFCDRDDVALRILIGMFMRKFDSQRCLIPNAFPLFLATCIGLERCLDIPSVK